MKGRIWIGGALLVMMLLGILGCGKKRGPMMNDGMMDGPGSVYTPEDQSPFAGSWQSRDGTILLEVESQGRDEMSRIQVLVNGETDFTADMWVYKTGYVKLTENQKDISMTGTFNNLKFSHTENAFCVDYSDGSGRKWLTRDGAECGEKDVTFSNEPKTPPAKEWSCPSCETKNEDEFCTNCGIRRPFCCKSCGWQPTNEKIPVYCPECGSRLK